MALLDGLHDVAGLVVDAAAIRQETIIQRQRLDELVASNDEHRAMVDQLEELYDQAQQQTDLLGTGDIPPATSWPPSSSSSSSDQDPDSAASAGRTVGA